MSAEVIEYGQLYAGGSMLVRSDDPEIEREYPVALWTKFKRQQGGKVYRRTVIVVDDWTEITE